MEVNAPGQKDSVPAPKLEKGSNWDSHLSPPSESLHVSAYAAPAQMHTLMYTNENLLSSLPTLWLEPTQGKEISPL